jgi:hypothetical protein
MEAVCDALADMKQGARTDAFIVRDVIESAIRKTVQRTCRQRPVVIGVVVPEQG